MKYGIDVAKWNGVIDWAKVKEDGIVFAILKATQKSNSVEEAFERNYAGCIENGIEVGAYRYVYAKTVEAAKKEAQALCEVLAGKKITYRVWLDMEDDSIKYIGASILTNIINAEAEILQAAGFEVGVYCNLNWYKNVLQSDKLKEKYPFWIARYGTDDGEMQEEYSPEAFAHAWQYTSKGNVNGISGNVDLDVVFSEMSTETVEPEPHKYSVGETVTYSSYYYAAGDDISKAVICSKHGKGKITGITSGARNPYQLDGRKRYLNDGDIRSIITSKESEHVYHTVKSGQNLTVIAKMYGTSINQILKLNPSIKNKNIIVAGAKIRVK